MSILWQFWGLCIAISAFTSQNYNNAQGYAISAASMFLIAFVASFIFKAIKMDYFAFISYISTAIGVIFLFAVIITLGQHISVVGRSLSVLPTTYLAFLFLTICYTFYRYFSLWKPYTSHLSQPIHFCSLTGIVMSASVTCVYSY